MCQTKNALQYLKWGKLKAEWAVESLIQATGVADR